MLDSKEIIKVLDNLVGSVEPVGETDVDRKRLERLEVLIEVTDWCLDKVQLARTYFWEDECSMYEIGRVATDALYEWKEQLSEM